MISLRYHIVSLTAAFLALAVGVVLGSTSLSERLLASVGDDRDALRTQVHDLRTERVGLDARLAATDRFASSVAPLTVRGQLDHHSVLLVTTPDAAKEDREAMRALLGAAGASVTGELRLTDAVLDPSRSGQLGQVVTRLLPAGAQLPTASDPGSLAGGLLGALTLLPSGATGLPGSGQEREAALSGLTDGGFTHLSTTPAPAEFALVLTGGRERGEHAADRAATIARLVTQLDRAGSGAVLAGRTGSADGVGAVGFARADSSISAALSTVDNVETPAGRVAAVLALREQGDREAGHYGVAGNAQGSVPSSQQ